MSADTGHPQSCSLGPEDGDIDESSFEDLVEELTDRIHSGDAVDVEAFLGRHPGQSERLRKLFSSLRLMDGLGRWSFKSGVHDGLSPIRETFELGELGDFRLLHEVGRGGMGVVYAAEQISLGRCVALKLLPMAAAMDPRRLQRFRIEAQAAACLHHPHIVPVHGIGCERGVHYYVMQLIEGRSVAAMIAELRRFDGLDREDFSPSGPDEISTSDFAARLLSSGLSRLAADDGSHARTVAIPSQPEPPTPRAREARRNRPSTASSSTRRRDYVRNAVRLVIQAAEALDHAHTRGILHRDIKPGNLLLDAEGRLWVTDFGLAQVRGDDRLTQTGDVLGTLRYMSPEQALGQRVVIDGRTDIYSLGATLYEMLTLRPAVDGEDRAEILRRLADGEPPLLQKLNPAVPSDLETIVLKATAKEPSGRYATAQELAEDLRNFLEDRPVRARRPGMLDRAVKWSRRHTSAVASGLVLLVGAVVILAISTLLIARERDRAESRSRLARQAVDEMYMQASDELLAYIPHLEQVRRDFLEKALRYYEEFAREEGTAPDARLRQALAYRNVGRSLMDLEQGGRAELPLRRSVELLERLVADYPAVPEYRHQLAMACNRWGIFLGKNGRKTEEREAYLRAQSLHRALAAKYPEEKDYVRELSRYPFNLGMLLEVNGQLPEAEASYRECIALAQSFVTRFPDHPDAGDPASAGADSRLLLGQLLRKMNRPEEAEANIRKVLTDMEVLNRDSESFTGYPHYVEAQACLDLAKLLIATGRRQEAEHQFRQSVALWERLKRDHPHNSSYTWRYSESLAGWGNLLKDAGRRAEAQDAYRRALAIEEALAKVQDDQFEHRRNQVLLSIQAADLLLGGAGAAEAEELCRRCRPVAESLFRDHPDDRGDHERLRNLLALWGQSLNEAGRPRDAERAYRRSLEVDASLVARYPFEPEYGRAQARNRQDLADLISQDGRHQEAEPYYRLNLDFAEKLAADHPEAPFNREALAGSLVAWAGVEKALHRDEDARVAVGRALRLCEELAAEFPTNLEYGKTLEATLVNAWCSGLDGEKALRRAEQFGEKLVAEFPDDQECKFRLAIVCNNLGNVSSAVGHSQEAERLYRRCIDILEKSLPARPDSLEARFCLVAGMGGLTEQLRRTGRIEEGDRTIRRALTICDALARDAPARTDYRILQARLSLDRFPLLERLGRWSEARYAFQHGIALFEGVIDDKPTLAEPRWRLAEYLASCDDPGLRDGARAIALAEKAAELAPRDLSPHVTLGIARYRMGDWRGTIAAMNRALELFPDEGSRPRCFLAMAYDQLGDRRRALDEFDRAILTKKPSATHDEDLMKAHAEVATLLGFAELPSDVFARP